MKFFISFSLQQRDFVNQLNKKIYDAGHEPHSTNLRVLLGEKVINFKNLYHATGGFDYVLPVISKDYYEDEWLQKELNAFYSYEVNVIDKKIILPIIVEDCEISEALKNDHTVFDFSDKTDFDSSFSTLMDFLGRQKKAFIIMKMNDHELELAYRDGISRALQETNYDKLRIDDYVDGEKISPRILNEIRRSNIVIADLTGERPNCYYEVGYAHALGRKVLLAAKDGTNVHFDLQDNNIIFWKNPADLKDKLIIALKSSINNTNVKIDENRGI